MRIAGRRPAARAKAAEPVTEPTAVHHVVAGDYVPEPGRLHGTLDEWIDYAISKGHDPAAAAACSIEDLRAIWGTSQKKG